MASYVCGVIITTILQFKTHWDPYYQSICMPFTPSYTGTSYEWDESQVSKGRHRKKKCKLTALSLNEHGPKGNLTSDHK